MAPDKTRDQVLAESGFEPLSAKTTLRTTQSFKERLEQAAAECAMSPSDWLRTIVTGAVELHEERERMVAAGLDPDAEDADTLADEALAEPSFDDPDYAERVAAEAAQLRAEQPPPPPVVVHQEQPARPNPRECAHPLSERHGPRCGLCGGVIGQVRSATGVTGRYIGRSM